ncbi:EAL domain-containing protein [Arcobacter sp. FWKO B]|uniref:EAL domain-containing protein n=1 Tax=Arcobacter sp. FWKO B TaxID=2593672 RepID=UPI0018A568F9|nr:EAL domain-containing protein [Arcobacter sp. FWKO B]QOG11355.1 EAL domain-containing protein [Arcobacter sp. FWKO B]
MYKLTLTKQLFWIVASFIIVANIFLTIYLYKQTQNMVESSAISKAEALQNYFVSMRFVYHQQFLKSGFEIDDKTVGFLPAHASALISDEFARAMNDGTTIRNVTDRPRNATNKADKFEEEAMDYFSKNPDEKYLLKTIKQNGDEIFFYSSPLKIQAYCLSCHGKKDEVLSYVAKKYDTAYDYEIDDIRGITSIKVPKKVITEQTMSIFIKEATFSWLIIIFLLAMVYYAIRELTKKDVETKKLLQEEVTKKTIDLQNQTLELQAANAQQEHLFSILRTVADCNQILITAENLDELIEKTAISIHSNSAFDAIKIAIVENGKLVVKTSIGLDEEYDVYPLEQEAFEQNRYVFIKSFDEKLPKVFLEKVQRHNITEVYCIPLRKDHYAKKALGVITICTTEKKGLNKQEQDMVSELAGDMGFAINSFYQQDAINQLSYYDPLTNLPNQKLFIMHLSQAIIESTSTFRYGAILFVDIDNFKMVNDVKGRDGGDEVIKNITQRLTSNVYKSTMISRFGGDKFLVLLEDISSTKDQAAIIAQKIAQDILTLVKEPFVVDGQAFYLTLSVGIVLYNDDKISAESLLSYAENAMHTAKDEGKGTIRFYDSSLQQMTRSRSLMIQNLKEGFINNQFFVLYQKQVDMNANVVGVEALLRWQHPHLGLISPVEFIPLAEESGLIGDLGKWVMQEAINELRIWSQNDIRKSWRVSVNVSPLQFKEDNFVDTIKDMVIQAQINPSLLRIELTEGILIFNKEKATQKIEQLKQFGISISIDDFGTGYSSLSYLKHLPIEELKIDQSFVSTFLQSPSDRTIIKTIITMGHEFEFDIIAEGVETKEQFNELQQMGCRYFQGYLFAKPCDSDKL